MVKSVIRKMSNGSHYAIIPDKEVLAWKKKGVKRVKLTIESKFSLHCAFNLLKDEGHFVYLPKGPLQKLALQVGDTVRLSFSADTSENQFYMPEEWQELMRVDPDAARVFETLTPGNKRSLLYLIARYKTSAKRVEQSIKIADALRAGVTSARVIAGGR